MSMHPYFVSPNRHKKLFKTWSFLPGSAGKQGRLLYVDVGVEGVELRGTWRAGRKPVPESTVTWRGRKGDSLRQQVLLVISLQRTGYTGLLWFP